MAPICFRVRNIPSEYKRRAVKELLTNLWSLGSENGLSISSLVVDATKPETKVATIQFDKIPPDLEDTRKQTWDFELDGDDDGSDDDLPPTRFLLVDTTFLGLTTLASPSPDDHRVDIIAVSGLGGHAFGSFRDKESGHMWLREALPADLKEARVMTYGHDSRLHESGSVQDLEALGRTFSEDLQTIRVGSTIPKIFIGHSLGGLIIKQSFILMNGSKYRHDILNATRAVIFFGVPSQGMDIDSLIPMVSGQPNEPFLRSLGPESQLLRDQCERFKSTLSRRDIDIICYYETRTSPTAEKDSTGAWRMTGPPKLLVNSVSARHGRDWETGSNVGAINKSHSNMAKFDRSDGEYRRVVEKLRELLDRSSRRSTSTRDLTDDEKACLQSLSFAEINFRQNNVMKATDQTCEWIFDHPTFLEWQAGKEGVLWIKGNPGSGKSTLFNHVVKRLEDRPQHNRLMLTFLFNGRGTDLEKTPLGMFRSLNHQLLSKMPDVFDTMVKDFRERQQTRGNFGEKWNWEVQELQTHFEAALSTALQKATTIQIMIDALDECALDECGESPAPEVIRFLQDVTSTLRSKNLELSVLFTCRHYPILKLDYGAEVCTEQQNEDDIRTFVTKNFAALGNKSPAIRDMICDRANGAFQWAALVSKKALALLRQGKNTKYLLKTVAAIPPGLAELYRSLLLAIDGQDRDEAARMLRMICYATRPLRLGELRYGICFLADDPPRSLDACSERDDFTESDDAMRLKLTHLSCGLAEIKDAGEVQFIHQSVQDFVTENWWNLFGSGPATTRVEDAARDSHYLLALACLRYFSMDDFRGNADPIECPQAPFVKYAAIALIKHLQLAEGPHLEIHNVYLDDIITLFGKSMDAWINICLESRFGISNIAAYRSTFCHITARHGLTSLLKFRGFDGDDLSCVDANGRTALSYAAENGREAVVKLLLATGADVYSKDTKYGRTPLSWAVFRGHEGVVKLLLSTGRVDPDAKDTNGQTPLWWAARDGHEAVVKLLLSTGRVDLDAKDTIFGRTPLWWAARDGHEAVVKLLLATGRVDLDAKDTDGQTPLWWAARNGHEAVVKLLLSTGRVDLDAKDTEYGQTPLSRAAGCGHEAVVKLLLATGRVDLDAKDTEYGQTPLSRAAECGHAAVVKLLLSTGSVDVDAKDTIFGRTPLSWAAKGGHEAVFKLLLATGRVDLDAKDTNGQTPLWWAARKL